MRGGRHPRRGGHGRGRPVVVVQPKPVVVAKVGPVAVVVKPKPVVKVVHPARHRPHHAKPVVVVKPKPVVVVKPMPVASAATFAREHKYMFAQNNLVLIRLSHGKQLRVHPQNAQQVDANGGKGALARWHAELHGGIIKLRNRSSGKYLRMRNNGDIDANGVGKEWCEWRVVKEGAGAAKLVSKSHGKYLAFRGNRLVTGKGGPFCKLTFIRKD